MLRAVSASLSFNTPPRMQILGSQSVTGWGRSATSTVVSSKQQQEEEEGETRWGQGEAVKKLASTSSLLLGFRGATRTYVSGPRRRRTSTRTVWQHSGKNVNVTGKPTMAIAKAMALSVSEMDNSTLLILGELDDGAALEEILKRHIMVVDGASYDKACDKFDEIAAKNSERMYLLTFPSQIGILTALVAGFASFPLVFDLSTAEWFNAGYVTTDVPKAEDLETWLEVGAWTWNWMEPLLGQISFFLLCLQFSRSQMVNLGIKPYTKRVKKMRAQHLSEHFPKYNVNLIMNYSINCSMVHSYQKKK